MNELLEKAEYKIDRVLIDLTLKFTKQMQLNLFKDMNNSFSKLKNIEGEMIEITHQEEMRDTRIKDSERRVAAQNQNY